MLNVFSYPVQALCPIFQFAEFGVETIFREANLTSLSKALQPFYTEPPVPLTQQSAHLGTWQIVVDKYLLLQDIEVLRLLQDFRQDTID